MTVSTRWRGLVAVGLGMLLGGCALLQPPEAEGQSVRARPAVNLTVDAPRDLRKLLETHLDLSRLRLSGPGEALGQDELQRLLAAVPVQARSLLETEGYFNATVTAEVVDAATEAAPPAAADPSGPPRATPAVPRVVVRVMPGPRARVAALTIDVEGELERLAAGGDTSANAALASLREHWPLPLGAPFRNEDWSTAKAYVLARLREAGYAAASWAGTGAQVDAQTQAVRLFVVADSGPLFRTGELRIVGLERLIDAPVRALAGFPPGTPATEALLLDYQERLQKSGLFEGASVALDTDPDHAEAAAVVVRVRENALQQVTTAVGISANTGPRVTLEHWNRKLFGHPLTSTNKLEWARLLQDWEGEISTYPGDRFYRWLVGGSAKREVSDVDTVSSLRLRVGRTQDTTRIDRLIFAEVEEAVVRTSEATTSGETRETSTALSGNYHLVWRDLDSVILPTDGITVSLQGAVGLASSSNAGTGPFSRLYGRVTGYRPLGASWYGQARVELGQVLRQKADVNVPETLQFRAGGEDSVRGYAYRSLGPEVDGVLGSGDVLFTASAEVARPLSASMPSLWGALFVDVGQAAMHWRELHPVVGSGVGLRWRSPVGPLSVDVAYGHAVQDWRMHLSVGIAY